MAVAPSFRLLGQVAALDAAGNPLEVGSARRRAVLAALLVRAGAPVSVDQLVDLLREGGCGVGVGARGGRGGFVDGHKASL